MNPTTRRDRLRQLRDERFGGKAARLAEAIGRPPSYLSKILNGDKKLGEELSRHIETRLGLPRFWLDDLAQIPEYTIDAAFLSRCLAATDAFLRECGKPASQEERLRYACDLYAVFHPNAVLMEEVPEERMCTFLLRWEARIRERNGV